MFTRSKTFTFQLHRFLHRKIHQTHQISRKSIEFACLLIGAALVAFFSLGFAKLAEFGLHLNAQ
ncbi:hypothetical protein CHY23_01898 [Actinobacillus pleuropneumoniae]|nr:hypothetical protein CHY23_01898 [Actinobacillus pleuropneumoniae]